MDAGNMSAGLPLELGAVGDKLDPRLKYDTSGKKPIVLIPQPSDDPNDPLVLSIASRAGRICGGR